ncbi:SDR family NAD(P)-dependent oxidoreductase [Novosphingobium sp. Fuku2-ISO-50]|uniref:SDR family NAD(P)-dependent oxidoreductase n=1 Tax=Novosphingobium sp. Fuku2-ISO-50 TaxID=1739114 RepID=UPI00076C1B7C|nr:SDR family NAD(P)-dependent oxidoreductase [Novosphingobium sp. Fuku2-ISO-50]KUR81066.1 short-chain dehydrogenase [Novosphingobium sp. Fuku2-ISO-50]
MMLQGKNVLVTGAASGIGRATAIRFAAEGAKVTIGDRNEAGLHETAAMMASVPVIQFYDAVDTASCRRLVEVAAADGLDVVCNISGILKWGRSEDFPVEDFALVMQVNTNSVFAIVQAALPHLIKSRGNVISTASAAGLIGIPYTVAYAASKHAVVGLTKSLAIEFAAVGVRFNAIAPGQVNTPMTQATAFPEGIDYSLLMRNAPKLLDGSCESSDIADLFAFLASDKARKITGAIFSIDGGQIAG